MVSVSRAAIVFSTTERVILSWVKTGRMRGVREGRRLLVDISSVDHTGRWEPPAAGREPFHMLKPHIARLGPAAAVNAYIRLIPYQRELLDAWCASKGIDSPAKYCDPERLKRDIGPWVYGKVR